MHIKQNVSATDNLSLSIRSPYSYFILGVQILLFVLLYLGLLFWLGLGAGINASSWVEFWVIFKQQILSQPFFAFLFYTLPWATGGVIIFVVFNFIKARQKHLPAHAFKQLSFYPHEVLLKTANPKESVVCPFRNTRFTLTVCPRLLPLPTLTMPFIRKTILTFQTEQNTYTIFHYTGFGGVKKLVERGKKFRSFSLQVQAAEKETSHQEKIYILFLQKQLNNYRKHGLMLEYLPDWQVNLLLTAILDSFLGLQILAAYFWLAYSGSSFLHRHPFLTGGFLVVGPLLLLIGMYLFNKWHKERQCAKKLTAAFSARRQPFPSKKK